MFYHLCQRLLVLLEVERLQGTIPAMMTKRNHDTLGITWTHQPSRCLRPFFALRQAATCATGPSAAASPCRSAAGRHAATPARAPHAPRGEEEAAEAPGGGGAPGDGALGG